MDLTYGPEYNAFRAEVKAFVAANIDEQPKPGDGPRSPAVRAWQAKLIANGYHSAPSLRLTAAMAPNPTSSAPGSLPKNSARPK